MDVFVTQQVTTNVPSLMRFGSGLRCRPRLAIRLTMWLVAASAAASQPLLAQGFLERLQEIFIPKAAKPDPAPEGPELPIAIPDQTQDPIARLPGTGSREAVQLLLESRNTLSSTEADDSERAEAVRELESLLRDGPDEFVWTTHNRWASVYRLAGDILHEFGPDRSPNALRPTDYRNVALGKVASEALRQASKTASQTLRSSWHAVRRDAGYPIVPSKDGASALLPTDPGLPKAAVKPAKPVALANWVRETGSSAWREEINEMRDERVDERLSLIPSSQAVYSAGLAIWRTSSGLQAVDFDTGRIAWNLRLPDAFDVHSNRGPSLSRTFSINLGAGNWRMRSSSESVFSHAMLSGGAWQVPAVDDRQAYLVIDEAAFSKKLSGGQNRFQIVQRGAENVNLSSNLLRAIDLKTGRTMWEIGGPLQQDQFERPLAGCFFLGAPAVVGQRLYVLTEQFGEVQLKVLNSRDGSEEWSQPLVATELAIEQDIDRRFWSMSPVIVGNAAICPTGQGWIVGVDIDGRELLWATRIAEQTRAGTPYNTNAVGMVDSRWRPTQPIVDGATVWVFQPDAADPMRTASDAKLHQIDLVSGEILAETSREMALAPIGIVSKDEATRLLVWVGAQSIGTYDVSTSGNDREINAAWEVTLDQGRMVSGRPVLSGNDLHVPVNGDELWTIDARDGTVLAKREYDSDGELGNLFVVGRSIVSVSPTCLARLFDERELDEPSSESVFELLQIARVTGRTEVAQRTLETWAAMNPPTPVPASVTSRFLQLAAGAVTDAIESGREVPAEVIARLESLANDPENRLLVERFRILAAMQSGERMVAARQLILLAQRDEADRVMVTTRDRVEDTTLSPISVRFDRWLMASFSDLWPQLNKKEQTELREEMEADGYRKWSDAALTRLAASGIAQDELLSRLSQTNGASGERHPRSRELAAAVTDESTRAAILNVFPAQQFAYDRIDWPKWEEDSFTSDVVGMAGASGINTIVPLQTDELREDVADLHLEVSRQLQSCLVTHSQSGQTLASLPLDGRRTTNGGETQAWVNDGSLFVADMGALYAFQIGDWTKQWSVVISDDAPFYRTATDAAVTLGLPRNLTDQVNSRHSAVVAIGVDCIVVRKRSSLVALSRRDASVLWQRDSSMGEEILGQVSDALVSRAGDDWRLIRMLDGSTHSLEGGCRPDQFLGAVKNSLLTLDTSGYPRPCRLQRWTLDRTPDGFEAKLQNEVELNNEWRMALVAPDQLVVVDEKSQLSLFSLQSCEQTTPVTVPDLARPKFTTDHLAAVRFDDELLVFADVQFSGVRVFDIEGGLSRAVSGTLASIDPTTGALRWSVPKVQGNLLWGHSRFAPVFVLMTKSREVVGDFPITTFDIHGISRQTGKEVFEGQYRVWDSHLRGIEYLPGQNCLTLLLLQSRIRIEHETSPNRAEQE